MTGKFHKKTHKLARKVGKLVARKQVSDGQGLSAVMAAFCHKAREMGISPGDAATIMAEFCYMLDWETQPGPIEVYDASARYAGN